jgi:hypothetical protein
MHFGDEVVISPVLHLISNICTPAAAMCFQDKICESDWMKVFC